MSIRNGKVFEAAWPELVRPNPAAAKAMIQAEFRTRTNMAEKLRINLRTSYGLILRQCTDYLRLRLEGQERWEQTSNERHLMELINIIKSLLHKCDKNTGYHYVAYHTLIRRFMLFQKGEYSNSEYKQWFKEQI